MKRPSIATGSAIAVLVLLALSPLALQAQRRTITQWETDVRLKLAGAAFLFSLVDARLVYKPYLGTLENNSYFDVRVPLTDGTPYVLMAVCDDDCGNLGLGLYTESGDYIAQTNERTTTPHLSITPKQSQRFTVRVHMDKCTHDRCYYGVGVYSR